MRYDDSKAKEFEKLKEFVGELTLNKTFLKVPGIVEEQSIKIIRMVKIVDEQRDKIEELENIVKSWNRFNKKLDSWLEKGKK